MSAEQLPLSSELVAMMADLSPEVQAAMALYRPHRLSASQWDAIREPILALIPLSEPPTVEAFHKQMSPLIQFVLWTYQAGFPLDAESMVTAERVETYREVFHDRISSGEARLSKATVNDYVSRLRMMGPKLNPNGGWPPRIGRVAGGVAKALRDPYTDAEVARFVDELATMPESPKRDLAIAILVMGLGFGPNPGEMAAITAAHLEKSKEGLWVRIEGAKARRVPVADPWAHQLLELAAAKPDGLLISKAKHKNALGEACRSIQMGRHKAPLSPMRLRITWMVDRLRAGVDARPLCRWAGLATLSSIPELIAYLPEPDARSSLASMRVDPRSSS